MVITKILPSLVLWGSGAYSGVQKTTAEIGNEMCGRNKRRTKKLILALTAVRVHF